MRPVERQGKAAHGTGSRHAENRAGESLRHLGSIFLLIGNAERRPAGDRAKQRRVNVERACRDAVPALGAFAPYEPLSVPAKRGGGGQIESLKWLLRQKTINLPRPFGFEDCPLQLQL